MSEPKPMAHFEKSCREFTERFEKPTTAQDALNAAGRVANEALLQCIPLAGKKFVVGTYEFARAIPSIISLLYNTGVDAGGRLTQKLLGCGNDINCRRNIARTMIKYRDLNSDSSWKVSDSQLDAEIARVSTPALVAAAKSDQFTITKDCSKSQTDMASKLITNSQVWGVEQEQIVYDQMAERHPDCVSVLKLHSPREDKPESPNLAECFKTKENPIDCLSTTDKIAVGSACLGEEFNEFLQKTKLDFCAELTQVAIPMSRGGVVTRELEMGSIVGADAAAHANAVLLNADQAAKMATAQTAAHVSSPVAGATTSEARVASALPEISKTPQLSSFVDSYKDRIFVQPAENRRFMDIAAQSVGDSSRTRFFDVENSVMKKLNDVTGDKNFVTSLTNYQKEVMIAHVNELKSKFPNVQFEVYSDFKSVKIAIKQEGKIDSKLDSAILKGLDDVYRRSNAEFSTKMKELGISVSAAGDSKEWFKAGYGQSVDEASLAARKARLESSANGVVNFSDEGVQRGLQERLAEVEGSRQALATSPQMQPLLAATRNGTVFPKQDVFDLTRKYSDPDQLASAIKNRYGLSEFSKADAIQLQKYSHGVDEFSPTILIEKRENVNLDAAHLGGASADFLGMGSANVLATAQGIAGKGSVAEAISGARVGEIGVTRTFKMRMDAFRKVVGGKVTCSGDDCVRVADQVLTSSDKANMLAKLASKPETRGVRMAFVAKGVPQEARMQLSTHGELIEKSFRKELEGKLSFDDKLQQMTFGFDMKSATLNEGTVNLVVGKAPRVKLSRAEEQQMSQAFKRALLKYNQGLHRYEQGTGSISNTTIRFVPGAGLIGISSGNAPGDAP